MPWMDPSSPNINLLNAIGTAVFFASIYSAVLLFYLHRKHPADRKILTHNVVTRAWSSRQTVLLLANFLLCILLLSILLSIVGENAHPAVELVATFIFAGTQVAALLLIGHQRNTEWAQDFGMGARRLRMLLISLVVYLAILPVMGIVTQLYHYLLEHRLGMEIDIQDVAYLIMESSAWTKAGYAAMAVVAAPLYEELIFRGVLFPYLTRRYGLAQGIVSASLLFALIHFHIPSALPLFLLSIALCLAYWRTGSLWVSIGIHAAYNGVSVGMLILLGS